MKTEFMKKMCWNNFSSNLTTEDLRNNNFFINLECLKKIKLMNGSDFRDKFTEPKSKI